MTLVFSISFCLFIACTASLSLFFLYPPALMLISLLADKKNYPSPGKLPHVSLVVVVRNGENLIQEKIHNSLNLKYPAGQCELIVYSDGSTDSTEELIRAFGRKVRLFSSRDHCGKIHAMNTMISKCSGDIVIFSDADALLEPDAAERLATWFSDPDIGGVCGQRVIVRQSAALRSAQSGYIRLDSVVKRMESRLGSITSNDGKLFAIRKHLFQPIPDAVTDDFFVCLSVISQGKRFVFEPGAKALIRLPSKDASHEFIRRRRIVTGSLRCLYHHRSLLNPENHGLFAVGLAINKGLRRLMPVFLLIILITSAILAFSGLSMLFIPMVVLQALAYALSGVSPFLQKIPIPGIIKKISSLGFYFCIGNIGTLLALLDLIRGKKIDRWDPDKT